MALCFSLAVTQHCSFCCAVPGWEGLRVFTAQTLSEVSSEDHRIFLLSDRNKAKQRKSITTKEPVTSFSSQHNNGYKELPGELSYKPFCFGFASVCGENGFNLRGFITHVWGCENKSVRGAVVGIEWTQTLIKTRDLQTQICGSLSRHCPQQWPKRKDSDTSQEVIFPWKFQDYWIYVCFPILLTLASLHGSETRSLAGLSH